MVAVFFACEESEEFETGATINEVTAINESDLPQVSQDYIASNFSGEVVTSAFQVETNEGLEYSAFLTNEVNLVFASNGSLASFAEDSVLSCDGTPGKRGRRGRGRGHGKHRGDSLDITEIELTDLPETAQEYISTNYGDSTILKILVKVDEEVTTYHVLVGGIGAIVFDADGNFVELRDRGSRGCASFEELAEEDLPEAIVAYLSENYPDALFNRARTGTIDEVVQIHVVLEDVGVLIFDEEGNFIELRECGMRN